MGSVSVVFGRDIYKKVFNKYRSAMLNLLLASFSWLSLMLIVAEFSVGLSVLPALIVYGVLIRRVYQRRFRGTGKYRVNGELSARIFLSLLPVFLYTIGGKGSVLGVFLCSVFAVMPIVEPILSNLVDRSKVRSVNLPNSNLEDKSIITSEVISDFHLFAVFVASVAMLINISVLFLLLLIVFEVFLMVLAANSIHKNFKRHISNDERTRNAIEAYCPKFVLYYSAPAGSVYQIGMWLNYLERIGESFIIVMREDKDFNDIKRLTSRPVIICPRIIDLDDILVPCIKAAFYVNNGMRNTHLVRNTSITHVQLLHGDSDKAPSYNPVAAMFDKIFVAGQAGVDRYHDHGVSIPNEKFEIVGRPQVENVVRQSDSEQKVTKVLYAPTWRGNYNDTNYCSLPVGLDIVSSLLEREVAVVFRPHPYSYKDAAHCAVIRNIQRLLKADSEKTGREHKWGHSAETGMSVFECFNSVDAMVSDVSSVVPDFLFSEKPFSIVAMLGSGQDFVQEFPLSRVGYVIEKDLSNLEEMLNKLISSDLKRVDRIEARKHYLGDFEEAGYADNFLNAARKVINDE
ncbi:CDP-glycerol glycerophosphotransferase family protein [Marinobacter sp. AL4B]|uniref:CDP-glycerol glycerophosphotransferase family protein n=1 Tax=Marinobacter sp. AL4B TaxID=2871173 RepID=UPI001CAA54A6|nr:CDP-glycerol glycerophosphotransferase family protein [Marinobacter sp. AL4B]MBZ0333220.1 CDP-glycerol glycerophosphotransferase family protein [Marinobacter sp. AL4B]